MFFFAPWTPADAQVTSTTKSQLKALPSDTTLFVRVRNMSDLVRKYKESPIYGLRNNPDVKSFTDQVSSQLNTGLSAARAQLGFDPMDLLGCVEGEVVFAMGGLDKIVGAIAMEMMGGKADVKPGDLPLIFMIDAGASASRMKDLLSKLMEFALKEGAGKEESEFHGGKITTLTQKSTEQGGLENVFLGELDSHFLFSISRPYLEQVMANLTSPAQDALALNPDFAATHREIRPDSDLSVFVNVRPIAEVARQKFQSNPMATMIYGIIQDKVLGRGLKNMGASFSIQKNGIQEFAFINNGGATDGLLGILKGAPFTNRPSSLIPSDVSQFSSISLNIPYLYSTIKDIYSMAMPIAALMGGGGPGGPPPDLEQFFQQSFQVNLKGVVNSLGGLFHFFQKGAVTQQNPLGNFTLALELKDEMPIKDLLAKISLMMGLQPQKYLDRDLYSLSGPMPMAPAIGLAEKHLVVGMSSESVKEVMRRAGKGGTGVGDTPDYQAVAGKITIPSQVNSIAYSPGTAMRQTLEMFQQAIGSRTGSPAPNLAALAEIVSGSISYSVWKNSGFYAESTLLFK